MPLRPGVCSSPEAGYPATTSSGKFVNRPRTIALLAITVVLTVTATVSCSTAPEPAPEVATADAPVTHDENPGVPVGASWTEHYFPAARAGSPTQVRLHADVLRPEGLPATARTPVILRWAPYFEHSGQTGTEADTYRPLVPLPGLHRGHRPDSPRLRRS